MIRERPQLVGRLRISHWRAVGVFSKHFPQAVAGIAVPAPPVAHQQDAVTWRELRHLPAYSGEHVANSSLVLGGVSLLGRSVGRSRNPHEVLNVGVHERPEFGFKAEHLRTASN